MEETLLDVIDVELVKFWLSSLLLPDETKDWSMQKKNNSVAQSNIILLLTLQYPTPFILFSFLNREVL